MLSTNTGQGTIAGENDVCLLLWTIKKHFCETRRMNYAGLLQ